MVKWVTTGGKWCSPCQVWCTFRIFLFFPLYVFPIFCEVFLLQWIMISRFNLIRLCFRLSHCFLPKNLIFSSWHITIRSLACALDPGCALASISLYLLSRPSSFPLSARWSSGYDFVGVYRLGSCLIRDFSVGMLKSFDLYRALGWRI